MEAAVVASTVEAGSTVAAEKGGREEAGRNLPRFFCVRIRLQWRSLRSQEGTS